MHCNRFDDNKNCGRSLKVKNQIWQHLYQKKLKPLETYTICRFNLIWHFLAHLIYLENKPMSG